MKIKSFCKIFFLFLFFDSSAQKFQKTFTYSGTFGPQDSYVTSMQLTTDSGYIVAATTFKFGIGQWEILLIKTDNAGSLDWVKNLGAGQSSSVQQTSDGGYIVGGSTSDMLLIKTDAFGNLTWSVSIGDSLSTENCHAMEQTSDKGYILTGYTDGFGALYHDIYLVKTDSIGIVIWTKTFSAGNGTGYSIHQTSDGGFILAGSATGSIGDYDMCLIKLDSTGNTTWRTDLGTTFKDEAYCVRPTSDGGFIVSGYIADFAGLPQKIALIKTDGNGNMNWAKEYSFGSSLDEDAGVSVQQLSDNGYAICGYTNHFSNGINDLCLFRTDSLGNVEWSKLYKGSLGSGGRFSCLHKTEDNGFIMASDLIYTPSGRSDIYLVKTDSLGNSGCHDSSVTLSGGMSLASYISLVTTASFGGISIPYPGTVDSVGLIVNTLCTSVGIQEIINKISFSISPNPATDKIYISFPAIPITIGIKIYSITGEVVFKKPQTSNLKPQTSIDVTGFSNGIYFLSVQTGREVVTKKIVVNH